MIENIFVFNKFCNTHEGTNKGACASCEKADERIPYILQETSRLCEIWFSAFRESSRYPCPRRMVGYSTSRSETIVHQPRPRGTTSSSALQKNRLKSKLRFLSFSTKTRFLTPILTSNGINCRRRHSGP